MLQPIQTTGTSAQPLLSNQRSQSAKPALGTLPNQRTIQSAVQQRSPVTGVSSFGVPSSGTQRIQSGYTRIQSGVTRVGQTRIQSAAKSTRSIVKDMFHIDPPEIVFEDIKPGIVYEQVLSVQNLAKHPVRIRVQQPKSTYMLLGKPPSSEWIMTCNRAQRQDWYSRYLYNLRNQNGSQQHLINIRNLHQLIRMLLLLNLMNLKLKYMQQHTELVQSLNSMSSQISVSCNKGVKTLEH